MPIPKDLLGPNGSLSQSLDLWNYLDERVEYEGTLKYVNGMSVIVSIKDARHIVSLLL